MALYQQALHDEPQSTVWYERLDPGRRILRGKAYHRAKRLLDLTICLLLLPVVGVAVAVCALLIKIDSPGGPVFFTQQRTGRGGRRFSMYKFRTMVPNAEELKKQLVATNEDGELAGPLKLDYDPRITRVGRFLRKTSLDELPQIFNVIKGDMSLVGPRPTSFGLKSYRLWHTERLDVLPGITGMWQLYGRGDTDFSNWCSWDVLYIEKRSLWLDFLILMRTVTAVLESRGAR